LASPPLTARSHCKCEIINTTQVVLIPKTPEYTGLRDRIVQS
jgi:hypothetical protein